MRVNIQPYSYFSLFFHRFSRSKNFCEVCFDFGSVAWFIARQIFFQEFSNFHIFSNLKTIFAIVRITCFFQTSIFLTFPVLFFWEVCLIISLLSGLSPVRFVFKYFRTSKFLWTWKYFFTHSFILVFCFDLLGLNVLWGLFLILGLLPGLLPVRLAIGKISSNFQYFWTFMGNIYLFFKTLFISFLRHFWKVFFETEIEVPRMYLCLLRFALTRFAS